MTHFPPGASFTTDDANIAGRDLCEIRSGHHIELKTGAVTDANIGLKTMAWALGDAGTGLRSIMAESMGERRGLVLNGLQTAVTSSQKRTMTRLLDYYRSRGLHAGGGAPPRLAHAARCVAVGITTQQGMAPLFDVPVRDWQVPMILHASWDAGWRRVHRPFDAGSFFVQNLGFPETALSPRGGVARVHLRLRHRQSGRTALFYPNYKNSFLAQDNTKIPASNWVKTPCFHVWIDK